MSVLFAIIVFGVLSGLLSVLAASGFLLIPAERQAQLIPHGVSFALGALLSVAFLDLLPEAINSAGLTQVPKVFATVLAGLLLFFIMEKLLLWRHCHHSRCENHGDAHFHQPAGTLIILGDAIHNFVDGILIAAAFMTDIHLGIMTSLAVAAHEVPQEVGDFAILLQSGYTPVRALAYNLLSSLGTLAGGVLAYATLGDVHGWLPYCLALAASSFIYIAVADLIPTLHQRTRLWESCQQLLMIAAGITLMVGMHALVET